MLELKRVSKFYSGNGVVTSGFSKVSLDFQIGEFVAITGESGSGKSTLLNVISGLDSYEEGEMYISGLPTSGYSNEDMENYRKRYIGNIFQTFNLINNYTVYQNVEMVLLLSGYKRREVKARVNEIIDKVGLKDFKRTKASKLSGGQKQRVAIARALAKETPIIVADEPTGNLDVASAAEIIKLLAGLAKDKLIIIVTHNYEQVEPYVTRKITMHDGRVVEDKRLRTAEPMATYEGKIESKDEAPGVTEARHDGMSFGNTLRLGVRNTFSLPAKFLLLLFVFLFLCVGTFSSYSTVQSMKNGMASEFVFSQIFRETSSKRLLLTKEGRAAFTEEDYADLLSIANVERIEKNDVMLDTQFEITQESKEKLYGSGEVKNDFWIIVKAQSLAGKENRLTEGRLPETPDECVIFFNENDEYMLETMEERALNEPAYISSGGYYGPMNAAAEEKIKIVGYGFFTEEERNDRMLSNMYYEGFICMTEEGMKRAEGVAVVGGFRMEGYANNTAFQVGSGPGAYPLISSTLLEPGHVYIPEAVGALYDWGSYYGKEIHIVSKSMDHSNVGTYIIDGAYGLSNYQWLLGYEKWDEVPQGIYMNPEDVKNLYAPSGNHQTSVMVQNTLTVHETIKELEDKGYEVLYIYEAAAGENQAVKALTNMFRTGLLAVLLMVLFFISYFIIKLIFKSRTVYFSTVRMLGGSKTSCSGMLYVEMLTVFHIAFILVAGFLLSIKNGFFEGATGTFGRFAKRMEALVFYVENKDFLILYGVILILTLLLALRYSGQMFKQTAMNAYKEEA